MKLNHYLAIDLGATSGRATIATFDGIKVTMQELSRFENPMIPIAGDLHWDIAGLYHQIIKALKLAKEQGIEPQSIGIDTWGCDVAYFDKEGKLLSLPYCYRGNHTDRAMELLFTRMPAKEVYQLTGIQFMPFNTLFQLDALRRRRAHAVMEADKILFMPDALNYMLTGRATTEYTVATTGQIVNPATQQLEERVLDVIGINKAQFGDFITPGTIIGELTAQLKQQTGQHSIKVISVAGHDTASAVAAVPIQNEAAYLSCGTWSLMGIKSDNPIITEQSFTENFTNEGGIDGTTRFLKNICGMWIFERCRAEFTDAPKDVAQLVASAKTVSSQFTTLINPDDSCFANPPSMITAIDDYCQRTGQQKPSTPAEYCNTIFRSLAKRYKEVFDLLEQFAGRRLEYLYVIGGGAQNALLMQLTADAIERPVVAGASESTTLGNVLMQLRAMGEVKSCDLKRIIEASTTTTIYKPNR